MIKLSPMINSATGIMMNDARRFAARTDVVCEEITTAPLTITNACTVVRARIWMSRTGSGRQSSRKKRPKRYTRIPR